MPRCPWCIGGCPERHSDRDSQRLLRRRSGVREQSMRGNRLLWGRDRRCAMDDQGQYFMQSIHASNEADG